MTKEITRDIVAEAVREHARRGHPEHGARLRKLFNAGAEIPSELVDFTGIKSEKPNIGVLEMPPRTGPGSGGVQWRKFAVEVSDLDMAVLSKMGRDEVIDILETRGIIPTVEEQAEEKAKVEAEAKEAAKEETKAESEG
jgi:hypothetical protein